MAEPFLGQISIFSFNFAPKGFALCNGQILPINQNTALFSLLGTFYGGNGTSTFALPNLQGNVPMSLNDAQFSLGDFGGESSHTLTIPEMPGHSHALEASTAPATATSPANNYPAAVPSNPYSNGVPNVVMGAVTSASSGNQPHENRAPFLVVAYCIALQGIFPSRN